MNPPMHPTCDPPRPAPVDPRLPSMSDVWHEFAGSPGVLLEPSSLQAPSGQAVPTHVDPWPEQGAASACLPRHGSSRMASVPMHAAQFALVASVVALVLDPARAVAAIAAFAAAYCCLVFVAVLDRRRFRAGEAVFELVEVVPPATAPAMVPVTEPAQQVALQLVPMPLRIEVT